MVRRHYLLQHVGGKRLNHHEGRLPSVQRRTTVSEKSDHECIHAACYNQVYARLPLVKIPQFLDRREYAAVYLPKFLKLVDNDIQMTTGGKPHQRTEYVFESFRRAQHHVAKLLVDLPDESLAKVLLAFPLDKEIDISLALQRLHHKRCLTYPPAASHNGKLRHLFAAFANLPQVGEFRRPVEEFHDTTFL